MSSPATSKAVLEVFWWNCFNGAFPFDWYTYVAKLAPRIAALGFDGIWTPPPCKDTDARNNMGYTPFDYYDIGQKNQKGFPGTRFGTQDAFLRLVAVAHANGLEVYPDIVLDHCSGGDNKTYAFHGFGAPGRWPRNFLDFHGNPVHQNLSGDWCPSPGASFGDDFCFQGRCSDTGHADPNCASRQNARAWLTWFVRQTGVDGFRFDDVKGFPPEVIEDILFNAMGDRLDYFCVGEYVEFTPTPDLDNWVSATNQRSGTFDYPLREALLDLVNTGGFYNVGNLPSFQQQNRLKTVPFLNNHDTADSQVSTYADPDNLRSRLAYAIAMTVDGSPQFYYEDLFRNVAPFHDNTTADAIPSRPYLENLVWCHQKLAFKTGDYFVRFQDSQQLLILERGARAIVAINNDGSAWHDAWISTAFFPNTQLHDYSGSRPDDIFTNADGWVHIAVPPCSYSIWGPTGISGGFDPASRARNTIQQFEMADDLGDIDPATPRYGGFAIPSIFRSAGAIWPAAATQLTVSVFADTPQQVDLQVLLPGPGPSLSITGQATPTSPLILNVTVATEGSHVLQARLSTPGATPARLYVKADYLGPAQSTLF